MKVYAIDLSLSSYTVKARNLYFPRDCLLSRDCLCTNGGCHGGRHLAGVTRCKTAKAVVKPFMIEIRNMRSAGPNHG